MKNKADIVIIGAGIVGCSAAYFLSKKGWKNCLVLDKGPLNQTEGSTFHAPGLVFELNSSKTLCQLAQWSVETYRELEYKGEPCFYPVGSIEIAYSSERWEDLRLKWGRALAWKLPAQLINADEVRDRIPLLDTSKVRGGLYVPSDGVAKAVRAVSAMTEKAQSFGVEFQGNTPVIEIQKEGGRVKAVVTPQGTIHCEHVLICGGIWGPELGRMAGISIPLVPVEHQYVMTTPLRELQGAKSEVEFPILRHQDRSLYFRQHGECLGIGNYLHEPILGDSKPLEKSVRPFTPEHFQNAYTSTCEIFPSVGNVDLAEKFNGMFSFTPDGNPLVGESLAVKGCWIAEAVWVTQGAGVGQVISEMISGEIPKVDLRDIDCNRFAPHASSPEYIRMRGAQQYREVYDIIHPLQQIEKPRPLRVSPFYSRHQELGAAFFETAGWERPQYFNSNLNLPSESFWPDRKGTKKQEWTSKFWSPLIGKEHKATREKVALFDLSAFTKLEIKGPDSLAFLQRIAANQIDQPVGRVIYTPLLDQAGGIMCDVTVIRWEQDRFWIVTGGAVGMRDSAWIMKQLGDSSVSISDLTSSYCSLGVWGPLARTLVQSVTETSVSNAAFPYYQAKPIYLGSIPCLALRLSYAGELGWEIYCPTEYGLALWDRLWKAGQSLGIVAAGAGAFDSLRLEKGYRLWGADIHSEYNPYEAGLGFAVKLNKLGDFLGKSALEKFKSEPMKQKLCCLVLSDPNTVLMGKEPILHGDRMVGYVTSANYGYTIHKSIAYGYLPLELSKPGTELELVFFGERVRAQVSQEPLFDGAGVRLKS